MSKPQWISRRAFLKGGLAALPCAIGGCGRKSADKAVSPMWKDFYESLDHQKCGDGYEPVTCSAADLDESEAALGFKLPTSYRQFMTTFGPGEVFDYFTIYGPGFPLSHSSRENLDLTAQAQRRRKLPKEVFKNCDDPALAARIVTFACTLDGHEFGWDPLEKPVETPDGRELSVYLVPRLDPGNPRVAMNFKEFIVDFCKNGRDSEYLGRTSWKGPLTFRPFGKRINES